MVDENNATMPCEEPAVGRAEDDRGVLASGAVLGRYRIDSSLGAGGMGEVYAATDLDLDRQVALKTLRAGLTDADARRRLLREAKAMARIKHPNVMTVYEVGSEHGVDYIVMELVEGTHLGTWAKSQPGWRDVVEVFVLVARGVAAAHDQGMIHRDLKPANILRAEDGRIVVTDFGVVRMAPSDPDAPSTATHSRGQGELTEAGTFIGTPAYAAPEQFDGVVTFACDQYSLGASLYAVLVGEPPHGRFPNLAEVAAGLSSPPAGKRIPGWLWRVIVRATARDPSHRYASVGALAQALTRGLQRRNIALVSTGVLLICGVSLASLRGQAPPAECDPPETLLAWTDARARLAKLSWDSVESYASRGFDAFAGPMDEYAAAWASSWRDACEATHLQRTQPLERLHARMACLEYGKQRVGALLRTLESPNAETLIWAYQAVRALPPIAPCDDATADLALAAPPAEVATEVEELRTRLAANESAMPTLALRRAVDDARALVVEARETEFRPVIAEALWNLGATLAAAEHPVEARDVLEEAALVAEEIGHRRIRAHAAAQLLDIDASLWDRPDRFQARRRRARLFVDGYGDEGLEVSLAESAALAAHQQGDVEEAERELRIVVARRLSTGRSSASELVRAQMRWASALADLGRSDASCDVLRVALGHALQAHRGETRDSLMIRDQLATTLRAHARWSDAQSHGDAIATFLDSDKGRSLVAVVFEPWAERLETDRDASTRVEVVDSAGAPQSGARVLIARTIEGDGAFVDGGDVAWRVRSGAAVAITDDEGKAIVEHPPGPVWAVAEGESGRSWPLRIAGVEHSSVELRLRPWASLAGAVHLDTPAPRSIQIHVFPQDSAKTREVSFIIPARADGSFRLDRLAQGAYTIGVDIGWHNGARLVHRVDRAIEADEMTPAEVRIEVPANTIEIRTPPDREANATVFVAPGLVQATTQDELDQALVVATRHGPMALGTTVDGALDLLGLPFGNYSVCVVAEAPRRPDPQVRLRQAIRDEPTPVSCRELAVDTTVLRVKVDTSATVIGL